MTAFPAGAQNTSGKEVDVIPVAVIGTDGNPQPAGSTADPVHTVDANGPAYSGAVPITPGTPVAAQRSIAINCTAAGNVSVTFSDTSILVFPVSAGLSIFPFAVTQVNTSGTTAVATYSNLK